MTPFAQEKEDFDRLLDDSYRQWSSYLKDFNDSDAMFLPLKRPRSKERSGEDAPKKLKSHFLAWKWNPAKDEMTLVPAFMD